MSSAESAAQAQVQAQKQAFIEKQVPAAREMNRQYGVKASLSLAQAILESDWGQSQLASKYHNLFGIKAEATQPSVVLTTQEYVAGEWQTVHGRFAAYSSDEASMKAHALLFVNGTTWQPTLYHAVLAAKTATEAVNAVAAAGYATDPGYAGKLLSLIDQYQLTQYDL